MEPKPRRSIVIRLAAFAALVLPLALVGCGGDKDKKDQQTEFKNDKKDGHDHSDHDSGQFKIEDLKLSGGKEIHAKLTAHLSKKGENELEVVFETTDKEPKRVHFAVAKMGGRATRKGDDKAYELEFVPAPKEERKDDPEGQCSHFSADAKWMKPDDELVVTLNVPVDGKPKPVVWPGFVPKKWGHEAD